MKGTPYFPFYPADFLTDENVMLMSNQEVGCYIKLLCYCWREGSIPNDIEKIAQLCKENGTTMALLWSAIKPCFKPSEKEENRLINIRLEREILKQKEHYLTKKKAGEKGAKKRWSKQKQEDMCHSTPIVLPLAPAIAPAIDVPLAPAIDVPLAKNSLSSSYSYLNNKYSFVENSVEFQLAKFLLEKILLRKKDFKKPNLQSWAKHIDYMIRLDNRNPDEIKEVISWCQQDPFWQNNILSAHKLRVHYDQLALKMGKKKTNYKINNKSPTGDQTAWIKRQREAITRYRTTMSAKELANIKKQIYLKQVLRIIPDFEKAFPEEEKKKKLENFYNDYLPGYIWEKIKNKQARGVTD